MSGQCHFIGISSRTSTDPPSLSLVNTPTPTGLLGTLGIKSKTPVTKDCVEEGSNDELTCELLALEGTSFFAGAASGPTEEPRGRTPVWSALDALCLLFSSEQSRLCRLRRTLRHVGCTWTGCRPR